MVMTILLILASVLCLWYAAVIVLLRAGLGRLRPAGEPAGLAYSVIIAARNEERNIRDCLESVLDQTVPAGRFEVIVVDDRSADSTRAIVDAVAATHPNISAISITDTPPGAVPKKHAVLQGMARAKNPVIVLTDADCRVPRTWLETVDRHFPPDAGLVQGITAYRPLPGMGRFFFGFQAVDFLSHGIVAAAAIGTGLPLNSNANNLAFRRAAFNDVGGYGDQSAVVSGDDDLLLQRIWRSGSWRVRFMADKAGAVETFATPTIRGLLDQRKRWGSVTVHYNPGQVVVLAGIFLFYCAALLSLIAGFAAPGLFAVFAVMMFVKLAGEYVLMIPGTRLFGRAGLLPFVLPSSFLQLPLVVGAVILGVFGRFDWKGQKFGRVTG